MVHKQLQAFNSGYDEVSERCKTFETQATELEFYAKLHGKLVKQAVYDSISPTKKVGPVDLTNVKSDKNYLK